MGIKNKSTFVFLILFVMITLLLLRGIKIGVEEFVIRVSIFLILWGVLIAICSFILSNIKIDIDKVFLHSGVYVTLTFFFIFTLGGAIFYNIFENVDNFIHYNFILMLIAITLILSIIKIGIKKGRENG